DKDEKGRIVVVSLSGTHGSSNIADDDGAIHVLESPDMRPDPARLAAPPRLRGATGTISRLDVLRNRGNYILTNLNGKTIRGIPTGAFLVREKTGNAMPRLMTNIR